MTTLQICRSSSSKVVAGNGGLNSKLVVGIICMVLSWKVGTGSTSTTIRLDYRFAVRVDYSKIDHQTMHEDLIALSTCNMIQVC